MKLPFTSSKKTYADYIAPLKKMVEDLKNHVSMQESHIDDQEAAKFEIERDIINSRTEIKNSQNTIDKISEIIVV